MSDCMGVLKYDTLTGFCLLTLVPKLRAHLLVTCRDVLFNSSLEATVCVDF
jgi:hypothetical protein